MDLLETAEQSSLPWAVPSQDKKQVMTEASLCIPGCSLWLGLAAASAIRTQLNRVPAWLFSILLTMK